MSLISVVLRFKCIGISEENENKTLASQIADYGY